MFVLDSTDKDAPSLRRKIEIMALFYTVYNLDYCWFSHDVTKFRASEILVVLRFYFHDLLVKLMDNGLKASYNLGQVFDFFMPRFSKENKSGNKRYISPVYRYS